MTFLIIMAGLFMLILLEKPFEKRSSGLIFLVSYLLLIAVYVIQTTFVELLSNQLLLIIAIIVVCPLLIRFLLLFRGKSRQSYFLLNSIHFIIEKFLVKARCCSHIPL